MVVVVVVVVVGDAHLKWGGEGGGRQVEEIHSSLWLDR